MPDSLDWENLDDDKDAAGGPATSVDGRTATPHVPAQNVAETADPLSAQAEIPINAPPEAMLGSIFVGRYELISIIGAGGMGVIFLAKQIFLERTVAIKLLKNNLASVKARMRFHQEAKAASALSHPGIVRITDFGVDQHDRPYMVMEAVAGCTFADLLRERFQLSFKELLPIYLEICDALSEAHNKNVIHRDLKPSNIMLVTAGDGTVHIKLLDFGIAKLRDDQENTLQDLTRTGEALGTPLYMSPEQIKGGKITAGADLYSLGCMLYATITGAPPFVGQNKLDTMEKHCSESARPFSVVAPEADIVPGLEGLVMCLLEKNPEDRFISVDQFKNALLDLAAQYKYIPRLDFATIAPGKLYLTGVVPAISQSFAVDAPLDEANSPVSRELPAYKKSAVRALPAPRINIRAALLALIVAVIAGSGLLFVNAIKERQKQLAAAQVPAKPLSAQSPQPKLIVDSYPLREKFNDSKTKLTTLSKVNLLTESDWQNLDEGATMVSVLDGSTGDAQFARLCRLSHLNRLVISPSSLLTDNAMQNLSDALAMTSLVLEKSHLSNRGLSYIGRCRQLKNLALPGDRLIDAVALRALLGADCRLRSLSLASCNLDDQCGAVIAADKSLVRLDVSGNMGLTARFVEGLAPASGLQRLYLAGIALGDDGQHALAALGGVETLDLSYTTLSDATVEDLGRMSSLSEVNLVNCVLTPAQWKRLATISGSKGIVVHKTKNTGFQFEDSGESESIK